MTSIFAQNENDQNIELNHRPQAPQQEDSENENQEKIYPDSIWSITIIDPLYQSNLFYVLGNAH